MRFWILAPLLALSASPVLSACAPAAESADLYLEAIGQQLTMLDDSLATHAHNINTAQTMQEALDHETTFIGEMESILVDMDHLMADMGECHHADGSTMPLSEMMTQLDEMNAAWLAHSTAMGAATTLDAMHSHEAEFQLQMDPLTTSMMAEQDGMMATADSYGCGVMHSDESMPMNH